MKTAYVIVGMHRSGTSSVAGTLALLGARPPATLMGPKADNPAGFWESEKITEFNDEIFHSVGSSWADWGPLGEEVFSGPHGAHFHAAARWLIHSEFGSADIIVLKDPRICRLYPFWRSALEDQGYQPIVVSPIRAPAEVQASLIARNALAPPHALRLWLSHVLEAEHSTRGQPRHVMLWVDFVTAWRDHAYALASLSGLPLLPNAAESKVDAFLKPSLRRQRSELLEPDTPELVIQTMQALVDLTRSDGSVSVFDRLDQIRAELSTARRLYYDGPR